MHSLIAFENNARGKYEMRMTSGRMVSNVPTQLTPRLSVDIWVWWDNMLTVTRQICAGLSATLVGAQRTCSQVAVVSRTFRNKTETKHWNSLKQLYRTRFVSSCYKPKTISDCFSQLSITLGSLSTQPETQGESCEDAIITRAEWIRRWWR